MPSITTASVPVTNFANGFASPYGNDQIIPLYSSIPITSTTTNCLPCVICGNSVSRAKIIQMSGNSSVLNQTSDTTTSIS